MLSIKEVKERLEKVHGSVVVLDEGTYVNTYTKARFIDKEFGKWWVEPNYVLNNGTGHPKRGYIKNVRSHTLSIDIIKQRLYKIHGNTISIDESMYVNTNTKCRFIDKDYGEWWAVPNSILNHGTKHRKRGLQKRKQTNLKKYGVENPSQYEEIKEKKKQTTMKNYGVENPSQDENIKKKKIETCLKNYGVENPSQNKTIRNKQKATCMENHGVEYPSQNPEIALKQSRAQNNSFILKHWKTKEEIVCVASWEKKVVEYFNKNRINFKWQHKTFKMPNGKTFRPDCYLIGKRKPWIEIKGYFRDDAKEKWEWFHKEYPNSELWDKKKLKEMKIL